MFSEPGDYICGSFYLTEQRRLCALFRNANIGYKHQPQTFNVPPRAAVLMVPIDPYDGVFRLAVTHLDDKISDQPRLRNPEMDGSPDSASARIPLAPSGASMYSIRRFMGLPAPYCGCTLNKI
jgi:hypothetical protein